MQCEARTKRGKPCGNDAIRGMTKCRMHVGMKGSDARKKGQQNLFRDKIGQMLAALDIEFEDPLEGLLTEVGRSMVAVQVIGSMVAGLEDPVSIPGNPGKPGKDEIAGKAELAARPIYGPDHLGDGAPHVLVKMWNEERERHARFCKMAIDAGIAERQVKVAEAQGRLLAEVVEAVLNDRTLKLTSKQKDAGRRVAARRLRALPSP